MSMEGIQFRGIRSTGADHSPSSARPEDSAPVVEPLGAELGRGDTVTLSPDAVNALNKAGAPDESADSLQPRPAKGPTSVAPEIEAPEISENEKRAKAERSGTVDVSDSKESKNRGEDTKLSPEEQQVVRQLQSRDAEVRAHEQAHVAASGGLAGSPSYSYQKGPDGRRYAVGGEVSISLSPGSTPEETIQRAQQVRSAALAPAQPSGQDRAVAAAAGQMEAQALQEQSQNRAAERKKSQKSGPKEPASAPSSARAKQSPGADKTDEAVEGTGTQETETDNESEYIEGYGGKRANGQQGHKHLKLACPFCGSAVAKYAAAGQ